MAASDRRSRGQQRFVTTLLIGRVLLNDDDGICRVRNLSAGGARLELALPITVDTPISLELRAGPPIEASVRWIDERHCGIGFDRPIDCQALLHGAPANGRWRSRAPRASGNFTPATMVVDRPYPVRLVDISQRGARLRLDRSTGRLDSVSLAIRGMPAIEAVPRWQTRYEVGVVFATPLHFDVLSRWLMVHRARFAAPI